MDVEILFRFKKGALCVTLSKNLIMATWNVNSVRARLPLLLQWLNTSCPDIVLLQETKCEDHHFPTDPIEDLGYNIAHFGQKTFNGVAILSKYPIHNVIRDIPHLDHNHARYIEGEISVDNHCLRVASVYVPNGQSVGSEAYAYKLRFLDALFDHLKNTLSFGERTLIGGDYNIAPTDRDVYDPKAWHEEVLCSREERRAFAALTHLGYVDVLAYVEPSPFTWWDYRGGAFQRDKGLRIDHILASPKGAECIQRGWVEKHVRTWDKTSDHAPVCVEIDLAKNCSE